MAVVKPFVCVRPKAELASRVAALPYDVYNRKEAKEAALKDPLSFLNIDRAESNLPDDVDTYDPIVYQKAKELLDARIADGTYLTDTEECYYVYELIMDGRSQIGIVACASIDDYKNGIIKKHENTREEKEQDRIRHVDTCNAQTGPIFLAYRSNDVISAVVAKAMKEEPLYAFTADDGITHNVWRIAGSDDIAAIRGAFDGIGQIYIADGHHRAASAVKVGFKRREANPDYTGEEEFNFFLSVLFPEDQLMILPYNRVVKDLNGYSAEAFLKEIEKNFEVRKVGTEPYAPAKKGTFGMYLDGAWYELTAGRAMQAITDPVASLDVSLLQDYLLGPVLGIGDPRVDKRIDFIGGIRGLKELERRATSDMRVAFSMYPTQITELFSVADAGLLMPPKSTWFEPKLRSGLFLHKLS
ncbi:MAG: DUF1015 domain-containing protein [Lachnospiraceae bacterium]|nr:DUF1015 domain-containing protein [Lachnospiraceae bacterium]